MTDRSQRSDRTSSNLINKNSSLKQVRRLVREGWIRYYNLIKKWQRQDFGSGLLPSPNPHEGKTSHSFKMQIFLHFQCSDASVLAVLLRNSNHIIKCLQKFSKYRNGYYSQPEIQFLDQICGILLYILKLAVLL